MTGSAAKGVEKLRTGIPGFEDISGGGLPRSRTTLVAGTAGSGKTVLAAQFLAEGVRRGEPGVFVTFEESPDDIRRNMASFGWDLAAWEAAGHWAFVDASPQPGVDTVIAGEYDMGGLLARIENGIARTHARRVAIDSLGAVLSRFPDSAIMRRELFRIAAGLKTLGVTAVLTGERAAEEALTTRFGVEEFVADNVVLLRNSLEDEKRRRTIEIVKFRGTFHQKGPFPFTVLGGSGIVIIPLCSIELKQKSSGTRIHSGIPELDAMCGGGFFRDSVILVSGATGTGKTLMCTQFIAQGASDGERSLLLAYEESHEQLFRNASGWNIEFHAMEERGLLRVDCAYPETAGMEEHLLHVKKLVDEFAPARVAFDSLSALERVSTPRAFREFVIALTSFLKERQTAALFTCTTPSLMGGESVTESHISTITDSIILLRYVEMGGEMRRGITVLKMRGSRHDRDIREFLIDGTGMHIGVTFRDVSGILMGRPVQAMKGELERLAGMFGREAA